MQLAPQPQFILAFLAILHVCLGTQVCSRHFKRVAAKALGVRRQYMACDGWRGKGHVKRRRCYNKETLEDVDMCCSPRENKFGVCPPPYWHVADLDTTCTTACERVNGVCDQEGLTSIATEQQLSNLARKLGITCTSISTGGNKSPVYTPSSGECKYNANAAAACDRKISDGQRFCSCLTLPWKVKAG
eukprot:m.33189 g.33189  ORF g.33189 m.33189 type:complete len:188 (+) comp9597_c0_seq2:508-1071(+)